MPASYLHQCIANDTIKKLETELGININEAAFLAGAEGPDPLFFTLKSEKGVQAPPEVGHLLHQQKTGDFLINIAKYAGEDPICQSFVLGFLAHYGTDTVFHPFIYSRSFENNGKCNGNKHCKFEHILDVYYYRKNGNKKGLPKHMAGYASLKKGEKDRIAGIFSKAIADALPEHALEFVAVRKSFDDAVFLCRLLRKESCKKFSLLLWYIGRTKAAAFVDSHVMPNVSTDELLKDEFVTKYYSWKDILNSEKADWYSYWEKNILRNDSVDELYQKAVERATLFGKAGIKYFEDKNEDSLRDVVKDMSYDSGLPWKKTSKIE